MTILTLAKMAHELNKVLCDESGVPAEHWENSPEWQKTSSIEGIKFVLDNPDTTPEIQHNAWSDHKVKDGWIYGTVKDADKKTHPCLVPFNKLPESEQIKDSVFIELVKAFKGFLKD